ncbi:MAG: fused MFS/spermidine synthase [Pseudomonadota bacterium]
MCFQSLSHHCLAVCATCFALLFSATFVGIGHAEGALIAFKESKYNNIYIYKRGPLITLTFGHNRRFYTETIYDTRDEKALPVPYTRYMTLALPYAPKLSSILEIGFGGGRTARYLNLHLPKTQIKSVELDPQVVELAKKYFGIKDSENFAIKVKDGRRYLIQSSQKWDVIMIDAYRGPFVPFHLLTKEFFQLAKSRLSENGIVVQNIEPTTMMFDSALATISSVFDHVDLYQSAGNVVAVAYNGKQREHKELATQATTLQSKHNFKYNLVNMLQDRRIFTKTKDGKILTDDFAPVESLLAIKRHNKKLDDLSVTATK